MTRAHGKVDDDIESFFTYSMASGAYRLHITEDEFLEAWACAKEIIAANQGRRDRLREACASMLKSWKTLLALSWVNRPEHMSNFLASVR